MPSFAIIALTTIYVSEPSALDPSALSPIPVHFVRPELQRVEMYPRSASAVPGRTLDGSGAPKGNDGFGLISFIMSAMGRPYANSIFTC
jgi:hypothetical protein